MKHQEPLRTDKLMNHSASDSAEPELNPPGTFDAEEFVGLALWDVGHDLTWDAFLNHGKLMISR